MKDMRALVELGLRYSSYICGGGVFVALPDLCHLVGIVDRRRSTLMSALLWTSRSDGIRRSTFEGEGLYFCPIAFIYLVLVFGFNLTFINKSMFLLLTGSVYVIVHCFRTYLYLKSAFRKTAYYI